MSVKIDDMFQGDNGPSYMTWLNNDHNAEEKKGGELMNGNSVE
jgi:hypothetical protein